jgi:phosphoglycolate phosphatase
VLPYKEIPHVLEELSKRYTLAVVTNNFRYEIEKRLRLHGLDKYFSAYYTCEDGKLKPHPDLINKCLKHFDVLPSEAAFVGDMDGDIQSAKAARIGKVIAVTYGYHLKHRLQEADIIIDTPGELLKIL